VSEFTLAQRILGLESGLSAVPHAFGGALALAYYAEPRATIDIDLNVFVTVDQLSAVTVPLGRLGVALEDPNIESLIRRDGQARVMWDTTPIDLFFSYDAFHIAAKNARHRVPFSNVTIPILSANHLIVCKVIYNLPKDWVDIDAMLVAGANIDTSEVLRWAARIAGDEDPRYNRIAAVLTRR
jgi:hypothetical protein